MESRSRKRLLAALPERVSEREPLARHTSFRIGGPATLFGKPETAEEVAILASLAFEEKIPLFVLGDGTNLLIRDGGIHGLVLVLAGELKRLERKDNRILAGCGAKLPRMVTLAAREGLSGIEGLAGIPGTVGGAIAMNAGTPSGETCDHLKRLTWWEAERGICQGGREAFSASYRNFSWMDGKTGRILLSAEWALAPSESAPLMEDLKAKTRKRKESQPKGTFNAGCIFKNPAPGMPAGLLIDRAGLKGTAVGDAVVSDRHANFILNRGRAKAEDILALVKRVRERVFEVHGVLLETEVRIVGEKNG